MAVSNGGVLNTNTEANKNKLTETIVPPILSTFQLKEVLNESADTKKLFLAGNFIDKPGIGVLLLEREPINPEQVPGILEKNAEPKIHFINDIYSSLTHFPAVEYSGVKTTLIYPATELHVDKYRYEPCYLVEETPYLYNAITLPFITSTQFTLDWVFNILEYRAEQDRIIFDNPDSSDGFVLVPDLKWDGTTIESLYLLAISRVRGLKTIRDLRESHLPMLRNIAEQGSKAIEAKYGVPRSQLLIYFHYQPSFYHLHVHFRHLRSSSPDREITRGHLLQTIISNLELYPDYYQKTTLSYTLKRSSSLLQAFINHGAVRLDGTQAPPAGLQRGDPDGGES